MIKVKTIVPIKLSDDLMRNTLISDVD